MAKTDTEIQELKNFIGDRFEQVNKRLDSIEIEFRKELEQVRLSQAKIEGKLEAWKPSIDKISDLSEKTGELKNWRTRGARFPRPRELSVRQIALIVIAGSISAIFGWLLRGGKL
jgi:hypothetical protein